MSTSTELTEVAAALSDWRAHKKTKFERIPRDLLARVRALRGSANSDSEICKVTGLAWGQLHPRRKVKGAKPPKPKAQPELIELPPLMPPPELVIVEIRDGTRLVTIRVPSSVDVAKLLSDFLS